MVRSAYDPAVAIPPDLTRITLIRHGESNVTVQRIIGGHRTCTGLSDLGRRQSATVDTLESEERVNASGFGTIPDIVSRSMDTLQKPLLTQVVERFA